ncbi:hypothetical protein JCGZ_23768 [Jatropha curcas]|uniref:Protein kinase domain-containing protein n=1 Tax=Jatropha curcas TaxID=180498 RepID=A0A067L2Z5_JATCU|nr:hypothetical protein JCGZ_23768 [Jatropha curcas]
MARERLLLFAFLVGFFPQTCYGRDNNHCANSSCGNISNITYPSRLETDPSNCGRDRYSLSCENNVTVLYLNEGRYYVRAINYDNFTLRLVDAGLDQHDYFSIPQFPVPESELTHVCGFRPYSNFKYKWADSERYPRLSQPIFFIECLNPVFHPLSYVDSSASYCIKSGVNDSSGSHLKMEYFSCLNIDDLTVSALMDSCSIETVSLFPAAKDFNIKKKNVSFVDIHRELAFGFEISWFNIKCIHKCDGCGCYLDARNHTQCYRSVILFLILMPAGMFLVARCLCGTPFVTAFLIYKWRRRHLSGYNTIEEFLQSHNNLMPIRYAYSDIKKMTGGFKEKLGEGGFGCVYKGKLRSGQFAAIKMLGKSKANGQDFINEVATIGRIHHANVVKLIGFCVEGTKRALVYEFLSNGSLDKYIFSRQGYVSLCWEKLYQISQGVARGIEYLHRGCEMQILHFDIKPHNILLDENFTPKISDFGLAKLYPTKGSIASLTAARGTIGYMAPELFYKNIGRVSYKADVYSFGMLLLEMTGRRKKLNAKATADLSEVYYPFWVYDRLSNGELEVEDATEEENKIARKMIITGLWCIQMKPSDRPPMNKVIEMLEGDLENLQLPPRPVLYPAESFAKDEGESSSMQVDFAESLAKDEGESSSMQVDFAESLAKDEGETSSTPVDFAESCSY